MIGIVRSVTIRSMLPEDASNVEAASCPFAAQMGCKPSGTHKLCDHFAYQRLIINDQDCPHLPFLSSRQDGSVATPDGRCRLFSQLTT